MSESKSQRRVRIKNQVSLMTLLRSNKILQVNRKRLKIQMRTIKIKNQISKAPLMIPLKKQFLKGSRKKTKVWCPQSRMTKSKL